MNINKIRCSAKIAFCAVLLFTLGCAQPQPTTDTRAADAAAIRKADMDWSSSTASKQPSAMVAYYDEEGAFFPPNGPRTAGSEDIGRVWESMFAIPGFSVHWETSKVEVARSGELGYSEGTYEATMNDPKGAPMTDRGKYVVVWKKQADGSWKVLADIFNSDLPAVTSPE